MPAFFLAFDYTLLLATDDSLVCCCFLKGVDYSHTVLTLHKRLFVLQMTWLWFEDATPVCLYLVSKLYLLLLRHVFSSFNGNDT